MDNELSSNHHHYDTGINGKSNNESVLEIRNMIYSYPKSHKIILNNINLSIPRNGYSLGIVGPSGNCNIIVINLISILLIRIG